MSFFDRKIYTWQEIAIGKIEARRNIQCKRVIRLPGSPLGKMKFQVVTLLQILPADLQKQNPLLVEDTSSRSRHTYLKK